jgi:IS1 family transposase
VSAASSAFRAIPLRGGSKKAAELPPLEQTLAPPAAAEEILELDELCSFVHEKQRKRWIWLALCRRTRQVVAYAIGVMVQGREALYTHDHGYDSDCLSPLRQRKHHSQRDDLQLQAALLVQGLRQEFPRGSPTQRLHRRKARGNPARLPGEIQPARAFAYLRRLAQYRDELARKKSQALPELSETLAEPDPEDREGTTLELDELCSYVLKKAQKRWVWLALCRETRQVVAYYIHRRQERREELPQAVGAGAGGLSRRALLQRLLEGVSGGRPRRATYGGRQGERRDSACGEVEQYFEAAAFSLRAEEPVVLQIGSDARDLPAALSAPLQPLSPPMIEPLPSESGKG